MRRLPALAGLALFTVSAACASDITIGAAGRLEFQYFRKGPPEAFTVEDGATNLDTWLDFRAAWRDFEASARFYGHSSSKIVGDSDELELNRRHLAFIHDYFEALAGHYYQTFGNGLILRTLEQRFVSLNRLDRTFNLDQNLDGGRVKADFDWIRGTAMVGKPKRGFLSEQGGLAEQDTDDLLAGGEGVLSGWEDRVEGGVGLLRAELTSPDRIWDGRLPMMLRSYRGLLRLGDWSLEGEYGESEPGDELKAQFYPLGTARYARLQGAEGSIAMSLEWKNYFNYEQYPYSQPPTLVRTQSSVLLNRSTHVVNLNDERGLQLESVYSPELATTIILNLSSANNRANDPYSRFREIYLSGRKEIDGVGAIRLDLDWQENAQKFVENQWSSVLELERFVNDAVSVVVDAEFQIVDKPFRDPYRNYLLQPSVASAGRWTLAAVYEHTTNPVMPKRDWFFASVDFSLNDHHDFTLGAGTRPAGLICSGGFCFEAPAFDGVEFRWLGRY